MNINSKIEKLSKKPRNNPTKRDPFKKIGMLKLNRTRIRMLLEKGFTEKELAVFLGYDISTIRRWKRNKDFEKLINDAKRVADDHVEQSLFRSAVGYTKTDKTFRNKKEDEHQWNKLKKLKTLTKCNTKYLFYNGLKDFVFSGRDNCYKRFKSHQFGCSIVEPEIVEKLLINNAEYVTRILLSDPFPKFEDFHPKIASPWRTITCCNKSIESSLYSGYQIKDALLYYPQKITNIDVLQSYSEINEQEFRSELRDNNVIRVSNEKSGRNPNFAIVITDKMSSK